MATVHVHLFGKFAVRSAAQPLPGLDASKVQELFSYLLLYRDRIHARETLAGLLWGDNPAAQAKKYLRQALWQLQGALHALRCPPDQPILTVEPEWVRLNMDADLWLDVALLEQASALGQEVPGAQLDPACAGALQDAVALYQGDLLMGWYQDWCLFERERLQNLYLDALDKLMSYCEAQGAYETGLRHGADILRYDHARERTHRRMMRLRYRAGDRTGALRQYQRCVTALDEELGVPPARRTSALYDQIRSDSLPQLAHEPKAAVPPTPAPRPDLLDRLKQLQRSLDGVQHQVQREIQQLERESLRDSEA